MQLQPFCFNVCEQRQVRLSVWLRSIVSLQPCLRAVIINAHIWMDLVKESYKEPNGLF